MTVVRGGATFIAFEGGAGKEISVTERRRAGWKGIRLAVNEHPDLLRASCMPVRPNRFSG